MHMITSSERAPAQAEFDVLCLTHRLEMSTRRQAHPGTIQWTYSASRVGSSKFEVSRRNNHDRAAEVFLGLARAANAERMAIIESERLARVRRSGLALACGLAMAALAFGGVMTAWTDVAAAPGLRSMDGALSIAAGDPADEIVPLLTELPTATFAPKIMETEPLVLDEPGPVLSGEFFDFVGPVGRDDAEVRPPREGAPALAAATPAVRRSSRARPFNTARRHHTPQPTPSAEEASIETVQEPIRATMSFGRDELESPLPTTLTRGQITVGLRGVARMVRNCARTEPDRTVRVDLTIDGSSGRVVNAHVRGYHENTTAGTCVTRALRRARFPMFENDQLALQAYPLVLR